MATVSVFTAAAGEGDGKAKLMQSKLLVQDVEADQC